LNGSDSGAPTKSPHKTCTTERLANTARNLSLNFERKFPIFLFHSPNWPIKGEKSKKKFYPVGLLNAGPTGKKLSGERF